VVLLPFVAVGQTGGKPLTDDDVISMVRGGLAESTVISAIAAQDTHFDVSAAALIKLKQQGVSPNIMNAMLAAARRQSPSETPLLPPQNFPNQTPPALPSAAPPRSVSSAARANSVMEEILGSWQGVYFLYPQDMRIDLELRRAPSPAGESITGEFRFEPLVQEQRNFSGTFQGSYQISGQYDSSSRTLALNPGQWIQRPNQPVVGLKMTGVFDARKGIVAGTFSGPSNPNGTVLYFVLARPDRASQMLFGPMTRVWEEAQPNRARPGLGRINIGGGFGSGRPLGSGGEDIHKIANWASRLVSEYPNIDLQNTYRVAIPAQNLFEDRYFAANFGKTYDQLNEGERQKIALGLRAYLGERDGEKTELRRRYGFLERYFAGFNIPAVFLSVLAQRGLRSWRDDTLERLRSLPADTTSFERIDAIDKAAKQDLTNLWPSERTLVDKEMDATRGSLAGPVLTASAEQAVKSAEGYEGAVALASWELRQQGILKWAPILPKQEALDRVYAQLDKLLTALMADELKRTEAFGRGAAALTNGRTWVSDVKRRYGFVMERSPVLSALRQVQARRAKDLTNAQPAITAEINAQKSPDGIDRLLASYFILPDDTETQPGAALVNHARQMREIMAMENAVVQVIRDRAKVLGIPESKVGHLPKDPDGPNVEEMYDALQQRVGAYNENMKNTIARCRAGGFQNDPVLAIQCIGLFPVIGNNKYDLQVTITHFDKVRNSCRDLQEIGMAGYRCAYSLGFNQNNPIMDTTFGELVRAGGITEARFLQANNGWIMMTLKER